MSTPRIKRQFAGAASDPAQRQITAFFGKATAAAAPAPAPVLAWPVLPADTESNLLKVGMRVRKSVPEGYKTSTLPLFDDTTTSTPPRAPPVVFSGPTDDVGPRELLPFCAINNIGGLSAAQHPSHDGDSTAPHLLFGHDAHSSPSTDDLPSLSCSQDSITSAYTAPRLQAPSRKRSHDANDESEPPSVSARLQVPSGEWMDGQVSPRSLVPVGEQWSNTRVMAVPRRTRQSLGKVRVGAVKGWVDVVGQENVEMVLDENDFPEADFLDYQALQGDAMEL